MIEITPQWSDNRLNIHRRRIKSVPQHLQRTHIEVPLHGGIVYQRRVAANQ